MQTKWNEMSTNEKIFYVGTLIFCIAGAVFAMLDLTNAWTYAEIGWTLTFAIYLAMEAKLTWNRNRKIAIVNIVLAALMVLSNILNFVF